MCGYKRIVFVLMFVLMTYMFGGCGARREDVISLTQAAVSEDEEQEDISNSDAEVTFEEEDASMSAKTAENDVIYVHVCGAVVCPGLIELETDSRVAAAIEAAGGFTDEADRDYMNLAAVVCDGAQLYIPTKEEVETGCSFIRGGNETVDMMQERGNGLVNLNTADAGTLCTLPGIGSGKAEEIISYREQHGGFSSVEEIVNVSGIGNATYEKIKDLITV